MSKELRSQLQEVADRLRKLREDKARLTKVFNAARAAAEANETDETLGAAYAAKDALREVQEQIETVSEEQGSLLRKFADVEQGRYGSVLPGNDGWATAARRLAHEMKVDVAAGSLLMAQVGGGPFSLGSTSPTARASLAAPPQDRRFVYPALQRQQVGDDLAVGGFTVSFSTVGLSGLTGVEREPVSTEEKAELVSTVDWDSLDMRQFATTLDNVPEAIIAAEDQLLGVLQSEMAYRINLALDAHCVSAIQSLAPPSGLTGANLIEQVRNAAAASRGLGANPSALLLNPTDAAALDLSTTGADNAYVFATRESGSASPLWDLLVRESEAITDPILLDPSLLGTLYVGNGSVMLDPYTGMKRNVVALRVEIDALLFGRDARGAYVVA